MESHDTAEARGPRLELRADCASCVGLCCVALAFTRSADFPVDKPAGEPCVNLDDSDACRVHDRLRPLGFRGCTVFDCLGAGQRVSQETFGGRSWRQDAATASSMFGVFGVMRSLHEMLWYLDQALGLTSDRGLRSELREHRDRIHALGDGPAEMLESHDVSADYSAVQPLLVRASELARAESAATGRQRSRRLAPGSDLCGVRLPGADLTGVTLRSALLIGADLSGATLTRCDVLAADLRDADLSGADLGEAIYLTPMQVHHARGDDTTVLPAGFERPAHWTA
jgi:uncharacterized protein YjbI with pentapeptide repeats